MKKVGKVSVLVASLALVLVLFTACGGSAPAELAGTWKLSGAEMLGVTMSLEDLQAEDSSLEMTMNFKDGKNVEFYSASGGVSVSETVPYTYENGTVTITQQGTTLSFTLENDTLQIVQGGITLILER